MPNPFSGQVGPLSLPATVDACELLQDALHEQIILLKTKLDTARREAATSGVYAERGWFTRAESKLAFMRRDYQRLAQHLATLRKLDRQDRNAEVQRRLIAELRELVGEEAFRECVRVAEGRVA